MTVALFKSVLLADEGDTVWDKLKQKVVDAAEAPAHLAEGWYTDAAEALEAHELAKLESDNAKLEANIAAEQVKLDGRTKAAKELKAKQTPDPDAPVTVTETPAALAADDAASAQF